MVEYRVMKTDSPIGTYQVQKKYYGKWEVVGYFDNIDGAKKMVSELREGNLNV